MKCQWFKRCLSCLLLFSFAVANAQKLNEECQHQDKVKGLYREHMTCEQFQAAMKEIDKLEARIAEEQKKYLSRPKIIFVGENSNDADVSQYMEAWRQKVEKYGNNHYPEAARNKLYGKVQLTTFIRSDGTIKKVQIEKSSSYEVLDNHAVNIVKQVAPYAPFNTRLNKKADILALTRTFTYAK